MRSAEGKIEKVLDVYIRNILEGGILVCPYFDFGPSLAFFTNLVDYLGSLSSLLSPLFGQNWK